MQALIQKYVINYILKYGGAALIDLIAKFINNLQRKAEQKKKLAKVEELQKDPNSKVEERADAYADFINSSDSK